MTAASEQKHLGILIVLIFKTAENLSCRKSEQTETVIKKASYRLSACLLPPSLASRNLFQKVIAAVIIEHYFGTVKG